MSGVPKGVKRLLVRPLEEGLGFTQVTPLQLLLLVLEDGHGCLHAKEAKLPVEGLLAWNGIEDDLLVPARPLDEVADDLLAQASALMARQHRDVADVRTVCTISQCPTSCDEAGVLVHEAPEHTVGEDRPQVQWLLISEWRCSIQRRKLFPIDSIGGVFPFERHAISPREA